MMKIKKVCAAFVTFALCVTALTACGGGNAGTGNDAATNAPMKSGAPSAVSANAVTVKNVEELLDAIAPGAEIVISPGYYNMSQYINDLYATEGDAWNAEHAYVELEDCYDGAQVIIKNVKNLTVSGGGDAMADTEIVIDPEYGTVFTFNSCSGVKLSNLTLGHTQDAVCSGNVVDLIACENVELRNMDLYGCGVIGLNCERGTGDVYVYDSVLRDCSYGPISIYGGVGKFEFRDCTLTGSSDGGYYDGDEYNAGSGRSQLGFYNCVFGPYETYRWEYAENVETENCTWDESIAYPDGEYPDIEPDGENSDGEYYDGEAGYEPDSLPEDPQAAEIDLEIYGDASWWIGYAMVNPDTNEPVDMPSGASAGNVSMYLRIDGTGVINGYGDHSIPFLWETDGENPAILNLTTLHDGDFEVTRYRNGDDPDFPVWFALRTPDGVLWMY